MCPRERQGWERRSFEERSLYRFLRAMCASCAATLRALGMKRILTFADAAFFPIVLCLAKHARRFAEYRLHVYDLGMDDEQKKRLADVGVVILQTEFPEDSLGMNTRGQIRAVHKMYCIENFVLLRGGPVLVLDADTLIIENVDELWPDEPDCIVVTARCPREHAPHQFANGMINSGVMAFGAGISAEFFQLWKGKCIQDGNATDQSALSDMLVEANVDFGRFDAKQPCFWGGVVVRDGEVYNDVTCRTGKIFHFKSIARRTKKLITYKLFSVVFSAFPRLAESLVKYNRKHRLYVWKRKDV